MTDKPYNLKVRVNMAPEDIVKPKEPKPQYHWGRILLALLVMLALFWGAFKLVSWLLAPAEPGTEAGVETTGSKMANVETGLLPGRTPGADGVGDTTAIAATETASENIVAERQVEAAAPITGGAPSPAAESRDLAQATTDVAVPEVAEPEPVAESQPDTQGQMTDVDAGAGDSGLPSVVESDQTVTAAEPAVESAPVTVRDALLAPGNGDVLSAQVKRFVLTNRVEAREPVAGIEAIRPDPGNQDMLTVFAFSEVSGLRGQTLRYRWLRNGKVVATVKVGVGGNSWRSYSSKFVTSAMRGDWRVELVGDSGQVLAFREFEY